MLTTERFIVAGFLFVLLLGGWVAMKVDREVHSGHRAMQLRYSQAALDLEIQI